MELPTFSDPTGTVARGNIALLLAPALYREAITLSDMASTRMATQRLVAHLGLSEDEVIPTLTAMTYDEDVENLVLEAL